MTTNNSYVSNARTRVDQGNQDHSEVNRSWRYAPAATGYCPHGAALCTGNPDNGVAPCLPADHHYCGHGYDATLTTTDGEPRCPDCRGITRRQRNPATYRPWRDTNQPALNPPERT